MKKLFNKNCIAFTLMEMTLVLLITSVVAAVSAPIVTSTVSKNFEKSFTATEFEAADAPWRKASAYDGGGIYNSPIYATSPLGINVKFGNTPASYKYPALAIESMSSNNLFNSPQIQIINGLSGNYTNLAMDEYENLAIVSGNSSFYNSKVGASSSNSTYIGKKNIFLGNSLQADSTIPLSDMYYTDSIFIGQAINTLKSENTINIGSNIKKKSDERNTITIGSNFVTKTSDSTYEGAIQIGNYSTAQYATNTITIGNYAAVDSVYMRDISIGSYSGYGANYGFKTVLEGPSRENIYMGRYAGAHYHGSTSKTPEYSGRTLNIAIGGYAAYSYIGSTIGNPLIGNIMIGESAGRIVDTSTTRKLYSSLENIYIGYYAGIRTQSDFDMMRNIYIGYYTGHGNNNNRDNILIGSWTSFSSKNLSRSILIGSSQDGLYSTGDRIGNNTYKNADLIGIGQYAGSYHSASRFSVFLGSYAGFMLPRASDQLYGNVGLGYAACANVKGSNKWCLGWGGSVMSGTTKITNKDSSSITYWNSTDSVPQMFIGYGNSSTYGNTSITLYANSVYRQGSTTFDILKYSDRRLKTNITPVENAIEDLRKVNIYDYTLKDDDRKTPHIGVLAQEYKKVFPREVKTEPNSKKLAVGTDRLSYVMLKSTQELDEYIQKIQANFDDYVKDFMGLKSRVARLEKQSLDMKRKNSEIKARLAKIEAKLK